MTRHTMHLLHRLRPTVYQDRNDWWVGWYRGTFYHYVCIVPTVVVRWKR